jgi:DNA-binding MurR/RpiR family transcriptional regulator
LPDIAKILETAPRIWFVGFGDEQGVARLGQLLFARLRHGVHELSGQGQTWANELSMTGPRDALILLTFEPRPKVLRSLLAHARTTRMRIITLTDHAYAAQAERFSEVVLPCHVASYGTFPTHATMLSVLRLIAVAYLGRNPEAVGQRISTLAAIDEELDLFE